MAGSPQMRCWICGESFYLGCCPRCGEIVPPKTLKRALDCFKMFGGWFEVKKISGGSYLYWRGRRVWDGVEMKSSRYMGWVSTERQK